MGDKWSVSKLVTPQCFLNRGARPNTHFPRWIRWNKIIDTIGIGTVKAKRLGEQVKHSKITRINILVRKAVKVKLMIRFRNLLIRTSLKLTLKAPS